VAGAGGAAHLGRRCYTVVPVIGVPIQSALNGRDSALSIAQMPKGVPAATLAINAARLRRDIDVRCRLSNRPH
jgi:5-(carboxyamino)imidazole ribonucleotide mutase